MKVVNGMRNEVGIKESDVWKEAKRVGGISVKYGSNYDI